MITQRPSLMEEIDAECHGSGGYPSILGISQEFDDGV